MNAPLTVEDRYAIKLIETVATLAQQAFNTDDALTVTTTDYQIIARRERECEYVTNDDGDEYEVTTTTVLVDVTARNMSEVFPALRAIINLIANIKIADIHEVGSNGCLITLTREYGLEVL